MQSLETTEITL